MTRRGRLSVGALASSSRERGRVDWFFVGFVGLIFFGFGSLGGIMFYVISELPRPKVERSYRFLYSAIPMTIIGLALLALSALGRNQR